MNGRHYKILFIITMQYALGVPPSLRTNIDYVFILREPYIANRKRIYENFAGWQCELSAFKNFDSLPEPAKKFIHFIEDYVGVKISLISHSPERDGLIFR